MTPKAPTPQASSPLLPFRYKIFTLVWTATVVSNIGGWMYSAAASWLMTDLTRSAFVVALVQVSNTLPLFMFALIAGVFSDTVDKRRYLIAGETATTVLSAIFAAMVWFHHVTPSSLLWFMFFISVAGALTAPAWQAVVPSLVPREALPSAISANSAGVNVSRAIGPAMAGAIIGPLGIAAPFIINAASNLGVIGALVWWREPKSNASSLPVERFSGAIGAGLRYAMNSPGLLRTFARTIAFFLFASAYWALLPLVARDRISGGAAFFGILLGAIGLGAVAGAFVIPAWKAKIGPDRLVAAASLGTAAALALFGLAREPVVALLAGIVAGVSWIAAIATLNVSAQIALPDWVRGRGLALYMMVVFGSMTIGSALWGQLAVLTSLSTAHLIAAAGIILAMPIAWRWKLQVGDKLDLTPSMQWPAPIVQRDVEGSDGPVLVTMEYRVADLKNCDAFLLEMGLLKHERLRDGAYSWGIFEDSAEPGRFLETFLIVSWTEHLRQHERVTNTDSALQQRIDHFLKEPPKISHFITH